MTDQQIIAPASGPQGAFAPTINNSLMADPMGTIRNFTRQPAVRRSMPALALMASVALAATAYWSLQTAPQRSVFEGLADADKAVVADALQTAGIAYSIDQATGSVTVNEDEVHRARMLLASQGLPKAAPSGDAVLASLPMGASRAVEGQALKGARETDLARTIEAIETVQTARVHLATPEASVFVRDATAPAASVMLTLRQGRTLSQAQTRAIRHLVASSVPGMTPDNVSIVDQSGALLSQEDGISDNRNFQLQVQMEERYRQALAAILGPMVGRDNYTAEVHVDVDFSESQSTRETFPQGDRALRREEGNKTSTADLAGGAAVGIPGALSNQPPSAATASNTPGGSPTSSSSSPASAERMAETYQRSFEVGREISVTHSPQGRVARISVAVAVQDPKGGKSLGTREVAALERLVKGAVGFDATRGDVVAISSQKFASIEEPSVSVVDKPWFLPLIRQLGAALAALAILFFVGRPLLKHFKATSKTGTADAGTLENQLLAATSANGDDRGTLATGRPITIEMIEAAPSYEARAELVRHFVRQDPERAALVVRRLMEHNHGN